MGCTSFSSRDALFLRLYYGGVSPPVGSGVGASWTQKTNVVSLATTRSKSSSNQAAQWRRQGRLLSSDRGWSREMLAAEKPVAVCRELLERLSDARRRSDALFALVRSDFLYERPIPERHRIIFYVGHLEAFDWNLLNEYAGGFGLKSVNPALDRLFAFGIDPVG